MELSSVFIIDVSSYMLPIKQYSKILLKHVPSNTFSPGNTDEFSLRLQTEITLIYLVAYSNVYLLTSSFIFLQMSH